MNISTRPVYFLHIAKCGGTTVRLCIDNLYNKEEIFPHYFTSDLHYPGVSDPSGYGLYRGHFGLALWQNRAVPERMFTWLREPVDRILSTYYFYRQMGTLDASISLSGWLENLDRLENGCWPMIGWLIYGSVRLERLYSETFVKESWQAVRSGSHDGLIEQAKKIVNQCFLIGLQHRFESSMNVLHYHLGSYPMLIHEPQNKNPIRPVKFDMTALSKQARDGLRYEAELDREVYQHGIDQFSNQYQTMTGELGIGDASGGCNDEEQVVGKKLRMSFFQWHLDDEPLNHIHYTFDQTMIGGGWQEREPVNAESPIGVWRWLGPNGSEILFPLSINRPLRLFIGISHSLMGDIIGKLAIRVNHGSALQLESSRIRHPWLESIAVATALIPMQDIKKVPGLSVFEFKPSKSIVPAMNDPFSSDYRQLSIAFNWLVIQPELASRQNSSLFIGDRPEAV